MTESINCFEQGHSGVFDENLNFPIAVHSMNSVTKTNLGSCIFFIYQDRFPMTLTINKTGLLFLQADSFNALSSFHGCFLKIKTNNKKE